MSTVTASPDQIAWRQTSTWHFVPFVARLFTEGPLRGDTRPLPADPDASTADTVHRLQEIWKRAAWRFLARDCGWRALPAATASGPSGTARLWQGAVPPLRFTAASMDLCLTLYNHTRAFSTTPPAAPPVPDASGDLILHHLAGRRLRAHSLLAGLPADYPWEGWAANPLTAAADPLLAPVAPPAAAWARLTQADLAPVFPWLLSTWTLHWQRQDVRCRPDTVTAWRTWQEAQRRTVECVKTALDAARDPVLWLPLLAWLARLAPGLPRAVRAYEDATYTLRLTERQAAGADWHTTLGLAECLQRMADEFTALHPADREPGHRLYLSAVHASGFASALPALRAARQSLRPALS